MKKFIPLSLFIFLLIPAFAQNVGIGTQSPAVSAALDITSTSKGLLVPRMTTAQRTAIVSPANGLMVYDITTSSFWYYNNAAWTAISGGGFALPYNQTVNMSSNVFSLENSGSGTVMTLGNTGSGTPLYIYSAGGAGMNVSSATQPAIISSSWNSNAIHAFTNNTGNLIPTIRANNTGSGIAIHASSVDSFGLAVSSTNESAIDANTNNAKPTINAVNTNFLGVAIKGSSTNYHGILGSSSGISSSALRGEATGAAGTGVYGNTTGATGYGVQGNATSSGTGVYGISVSGTALKGFSSSGYALDINGKVKIAGGNTSPSAGAVLTSDAQGNAVWKNNKIAFRAEFAGAAAQDFANKVWQRVHFTTELYDYTGGYALHTGSNPGLVTSSFTIPVSGLYHFDAGVQISDAVMLFTQFHLVIDRNGTLIYAWDEPNDNLSADGDFAWSQFSLDYQLQAGDRVYLEVYQWSDEWAKVAKGFFNGHLVFAD